MQLIRVNHWGDLIQFIYLDTQNCKESGVNWRKRDADPEIWADAFRVFYALWKTTRRKRLFNSLGCNVLAIDVKYAGGEAYYE